MSGTPGVAVLMRFLFSVYPTRASLSTLGEKVCTKLNCAFGRYIFWGLVKPRAHAGLHGPYRSVCFHQLNCKNVRLFAFGSKSSFREASFPLKRSGESSGPLCVPKTATLFS